MPHAHPIPHPLRPTPSRVAAVLLLLLPLLPRAQAAEPQPANTRILTSFLPVHSLALSIAGSRLKVENWLPQGIDPHEFQFQPRDLRKLRNAELLIVGGLGLEGWKESRLRDACSNPRLRLLEAATGLPATALIPSSKDATGNSATHADTHDHDHEHAAGESAHDHGHDHGEDGGPNPHFWLDPTLVAHAATNVLNALVDLDPAGRDLYTRNTADTVARLQSLDQDFAKGLAPFRQVPFITYHNAFPYLARRYGLRLVGVVEANAAEEPSPRELARLNALVRGEKVRVLFVDGQPSRLARRLASDLGLTIATLETLETGTLSATAYEAGMRRNLEALTRALGQAQNGAAGAR